MRRKQCSLLSEVELTDSIRIFGDTPLQAWLLEDETVVVHICQRIVPIGVTGIGVENHCGIDILQEVKVCSRNFQTVILIIIADDMDVHLVDVSQNSIIVRVAIETLMVVEVRMK